MFPAKPDFTTDKPGSAWFWWKDPDNKEVWVYQTSLARIVYTIQEQMKAIFSNMSLSDWAGCQQNSDVSTDPDEIRVNGVLDPHTMVWFARFLCFTGNKDVANEIMGLVGLNAKITPRVARYMVWLAHFLVAGHVTLNQSAGQILDEVKRAGDGIYLDPSSILPVIKDPNSNADPNKFWWSMSMAYTDLENPPPATGYRKWPVGVTIPAAIAAGAQEMPASLRAPAAPAPAAVKPPAKGGSGGLILLAGAAAAAWYFMRDKG